MKEANLPWLFCKKGPIYFFCAVCFNSDFSVNFWSILLLSNTKYGTSALDSTKCWRLDIIFEINGTNPYLNLDQTIVWRVTFAYTWMVQVYSALSSSLLFAIIIIFLCNVVALESMHFLIFCVLFGNVDSGDGLIWYFLVTLPFVITLLSFIKFFFCYVEKPACTYFSPP